MCVKYVCSCTFVFIDVSNNIITLPGFKVFVVPANVLSTHRRYGLVPAIGYVCAFTLGVVSGPNDCNCNGNGNGDKVFVVQLNRYRVQLAVGGVGGDIAI